MHIMRRILILIIFSVSICATAQQNTSTRPAWFLNIESDGYVNKKGEKLEFPAELFSAEEFFNGYAKIIMKAPGKILGNRYIINENGEVVLDIDELGVTTIGVYKSNMFVAELNGKRGFLDINGNWIKDPIYDRATGFNNGIAELIQGKTVYIVDTDFNILDKRIVGERAYAYSRYFSENRASAVGSKNLLEGYVDEYGEIVIPLIYKHVTSFSEGVAAVQREDGKWICIDKQGKRLEQIPASDYLGPFNNGLAVIYQNEKGGYINRAGKIVVPCKYDYVTDFVDGYAAVTMAEPAGRGSEYIPRSQMYMNGEGIYAFIDTTGELITGFDYHRIPLLYKGGVAYTYKLVGQNKKMLVLVDLDNNANIIEKGNIRDK
jgi:hypothetical protein